jgi:DNA repair protein RecO (recombination protein O)
VNVSGAVKLTAVVLRSVDYGEADRVVTLLSRERGKVAAFARAARASRRRFGGALELFTLVRAEAKERRGGGMLGLESVAVERGFGAIRGDLARIACASYACDLARELVRDAEPHDELFTLVVAYLARLDAAPAQPSALRAFELGALAAAGLMPRLDACARCGGPLEDAGALPFAPDHGGVVCARCAPSAGRAPRLGPSARAALARYQAGGLEAAEASPLGRAEAHEAREALSAFIEHHLGQRLASRKFLDEVGPLLGG